MKVALCLSGQPRAWKLAQEGYTEFLSELKRQIRVRHPACVIDTFIHMWNFNTASNTIEELKSLDEPFTTTYRKNSTTISPEEIQEILHFYNPLKYKIDNIDVSMAVIEKAVMLDVPVSWAASQYYSIQQSSLLKRQLEIECQQEYDVCLRLRFDLDFKSDPLTIPYLTDVYFSGTSLSKHLDKGVEKEHAHIISHIPSHIFEPEKNTMYSVHNSWHQKHWPFYKVGDIFFYSDSLTFDLICNFYDWILLFPSDLFSNEVSPELVFCYYLNMLKINVFPLELNPGIVRS
jgi:hypothetical protein